MDERRAKILDEMGIPVYVRRPAEVQVATHHDAPAEATVADDAAPSHGESVAGMDWPELERTVAACTRCALHSTRTQTVFGVGDRDARWLVIGEAPGADEDAQGEPFVGRAGRLLNSMIEATGAVRGQVFIANILKCRPPGNRDPKPEEAAACRGYLLRQVALVKPDLIIAVGRIAAQNLLETDTPIGKLRGRVHEFKPTGTPVVATYHPAYLLRSPGQKRRAWEDLELAMRVAAPVGN